MNGLHIITNTVLYLYNREVGMREERHRISHNDCITIFAIFVKSPTTPIPEYTHTHTSIILEKFLISRDPDL